MLKGISLGFQYDRLAFFQDRETTHPQRTSMTMTQLTQTLTFLFPFQEVRHEGKIILF
jgi:hypothetical protein